MSAASLIHRIRTDNHLSQTGLADMLEVTRQAVNSWEKGTSSPSMQNLYKIAAVFGGSIAAIIHEVAEVDRFRSMFVTSVHRVETYDVGLNAAFRRIQDVPSCCRFLSMLCAARSLEPFQEPIRWDERDKYKTARHTFAQHFDVIDALLTQNIHAESVEAIIADEHILLYQHGLLASLSPDTVEFVRAQACRRNERYSIVFRLIGDQEDRELWCVLRP